MDFDDLVSQFGGVFSTKQLLSTGESAASIRAAVADGTIVHIRRGWYAMPDADATVAAAVTRRGVLSCCSALEWHGLWVPEQYEGQAHIRVTRHERRKKHQECIRHGRPTPADGAIDDVATALQYAACCMDVESFIVVCDSALHQGKVTEKQLAADFVEAPARIRDAIAKCDKLSGSGVETIGRLRFRGQGVRVRTQHHVPGVRHIDLLLGDCLAVEVDSVKHHTGEDEYERDRKIDRKLLRAGYIPLRLTYRNIVHEWDETYADVQAILQMGIHRNRAQAKDAEPERHSSPPSGDKLIA